MYHLPKELEKMRFTVWFTLIGNHLKFVFFPPVPSDYIFAKVIMPEGTQIELTQIAVQKVEEGLNKLTKDLESKGFNEVFDNRLITIGGTVFDGSGGPMGENPGRLAPNRGEIAVELFKREDLASGGKIKELSAPNLANKWREMIAPVIGAKSISFYRNARCCLCMP